MSISRISMTDWYQGVEYGVIHFNTILYNWGLIKTKLLLPPCDSEVLSQDTSSSGCEIGHKFVGLLNRTQVRRVVKKDTSSPSCEIRFKLGAYMWQYMKAAAKCLSSPPGRHVYWLSEFVALSHRRTFSTAKQQLISDQPYVT